jgi:hypothetical protein
MKAEKSERGQKYGDGIPAVMVYVYLGDPFRDDFKKG